MFEDGMSVEAFEMILRWLYTGSCDYIEINDSEVTMELISIANLFGLENLVQVCELQLSSILAKHPDLAGTCVDFAER